MKLASLLVCCSKTSVFRGSELQLRHKVQAFNRALAPEKQILAFSRSLLVCLAASVVLAPTVSAQGLPTEKVLTIEVAQTMAQEAMLQCRAKGYKVTVTVVDRGNELKALLRDDGAGLGSVQIGRMKTNSVMHFGFPSGPPAANPPPGTATPVPMSDSVFAKGGIPIKVGDDLLGAISVSGAHNGEQDADCAKAGLAKVADRLK
jgi:uncharacterized protein GlcG (DUF336 family)